MEPSFSWINGNLSNLVKANVSKVGVIGANQPTPSHVPSHSGSSNGGLKELVERFDKVRQGEATANV